MTSAFKKTLVAGAMSLCALSAPAAAATPAKSLFAQNCSLCHGTRGEGTKTGASLKVSDLRAINPKITDAELKKVVKSGRRNMPAFRTTLKDAQITELVKYVRSLNPKSARTSDQAFSANPLSSSSAVQGGTNVTQPKSLNAQEARGKHLFLQNCSLCHLSTYSKLPDWKESTNTPRPVGPSLNGELDNADADKEKAVRAMIMNGTIHMPGFRYALSPKQIDDLVAYMKTQKEQK